jgi:hypothetical protein
MKITEFTATAEILGKQRIVKVSETLDYEGDKEVRRFVTSIVDMSADEAQVAIRMLGNATYTKVEVNTPDPDRFVQAVADAASPAEGEPKKEPARKGRKPADAKPDTSAEAKKDEVPAASSTETKQETPAVEEKQPEPPKEEKAAKPKKDKPATTTGTVKAMELPDNIKQTGSMKELLYYMVEHGVANVDQLVEQCKALHQVVPVLSKVPDVDTRIRRAVEVLNLFADDEAAAPAN